MIRVRDLTFAYEGAGTPVLRGVSLDVASGELVLLIGPAGCGKSTLLLCLNGLIPHRIPGQYRGRVVVAGREVATSDVAHMAERVGLVFQDPEAQFVMLYVEDEVAFGLENLRYPREVMWQRVRRSLDQVGLSHKLGARLDRLSGGEKQKVALASVLAMEPDVLALDAPTANLDPRSAAEFWELVRQLKAGGQHTFVVVEQRVDALLDVADRLVLLGRDGRVVADGPPAQVAAELGVAGLAELGVWVPHVWELAEATGVSGGSTPLTLGEVSRRLAERLNGCAPVAVPAPPAPAPGPPLLRVQGLSFRYPDGTLALRDVTLEVAEGDFCAVVGQNGAGKTTLARCLTGLLPVPPGTVFLEGPDLAGLALREIVGRVGYVFQNPEHQFVADTVFDELAYGLRARGADEATVRARVRELLERFGLRERAAAHPFELSRSEKRLLSVAAMLIVEPRVLILDEPTLGLDRPTAQALMEHLRALNRAGTTVVLITHDMALVAEYARTAVVMADGRVRFHGPVRDLFARPDVLEAAALTPPPAVALSWQVQERRPDFPVLLSVAEWRALASQLACR